MSEVAMEVPAGATIAECVPAAERGGVVAARVNGRVVDLATRLESGGPVDCVTAESPEGLALIRHSAAHLMAAAVEALFPGTRFAIGPAIEDGFYYDLELPRPLTPEDLPAIEAKMAELQAVPLAYVRREVPIGEALDRFRRLDQPYKVEILEDLLAHRAEGELTGEANLGAAMVSFYETGRFVDLCRGPHVPDTRAIPAFKLTHLAGAYWRGDERRPMLTRIYGTAFASREALAAHLLRLEEAKRRDHRRLGRELDLYSIDESVGGGLVLWHPKGGLVRKLIEDHWRAEHLAGGYDLVYTPHVGRDQLWKTSGHLDFYRENMYAGMEVEGTEYFVKPMNCPFHIMIYRSRVRSYRELPIRYGELGTVYRYERGGVLHGLLRVRGFTQDDAHIFCRPEQVTDEVVRAVEFSLRLLRTFGFTDVEAYVATRPEKAVGTPEEWARAEEAIRVAAEQAQLAYAVDEGGGAFYGPKIDLKIRDCLGRAWQCTTVQFDFNLPERFDLAFVGEDNRPHRPVMVHRALLGSLERFLGVLVEHYGGAFPTWLAPVQARLLPIADRHHAAAAEICATLRTAGVRVEVDGRNEKVGFKIREVEVQKVPYALVVGDRELAESTASVRARGGVDRGRMTAAAFLEAIRPELAPPRA